MNEKYLSFNNQVELILIYLVNIHLIDSNTLVIQICIHTHTNINI